MSYALCLCHLDGSQNVWAKRSLTVDGALVAGTIIIGCLILTGAIDLGLPIGVGTVGYQLGLGLIGTGLSIIVFDLLAVILINRKKGTNVDEMATIRERIDTIFATPPDATSKGQPKSEKRPTAANQHQGLEGAPSKGYQQSGLPSAMGKGRSASLPVLSQGLGGTPSKGQIARSPLAKGGSGSPVVIDTSIKPELKSSDTPDMPLHLHKEHWRKIILETPTYKASVAEDEAAVRVPCSKIVDRLYLGNGESLVNAYLGTSEVSFVAIVTMCPLTTVRHDFARIAPELLQGPLRQSLLEKGIAWAYIGKTAHDEEAYFPAYVMDCSVNDQGNPLFQRSYSVDDKQYESFDDQLFKYDPNVPKDVIPAKGVQFEGFPVKERFKYVNEFIRSWMEKGNVLVHCQVGRSRSAGVVTNYIATELGITYEQAENYVGTKRACAGESAFRKLLIQHVEELQKLQAEGQD